MNDTDDPGLAAGASSGMGPMPSFDEQVRARFGSRFEIGPALGEGGMGAVFRVRRDGEDFALKVLLPHAVADSRTLERFMLEGKILAAIDHPNVLKVHEVGQVEGWPFLLCEIVDGGGLDEKLKSGPLTWEEAFRICSKVLEGLGAAHDMKVIHRDLKPSNILLTADGVPKVADFGIAKAHEGFESRKTTTGIIMGTPAYIAPEVLKEEPVTPRADVFSMGVMLYELITGELPWKADNVQELMTTRLNNKVPALSQQIRGVPRTLDALLQTALAPNPVDRFPSALTFRTALVRTREKLVQNLGQASMQQTARFEAKLARQTTMAGPAPMDSTSAVAAAPRPKSALADHVPRRLTPKAATPESSTSPAVLVLGSAGVLGIFLIAGILFSRSRGPDRVETPLMRGVTSVALMEPEQRFADQLITLMGSGLAGPGFQEKLASIEQFDDSSQARILFNVWNDAPEKYFLELAGRFARIPHPLALEPIAWLLYSTPDAHLESIRGDAARNLIELLDQYSDPNLFPRPEATLKKFESVLTTTVEGARDEDPRVIRAAIRYVGWLGSSRTSEGCIDAMLEAPSRVAWLDALPGTSPTREIRRALKNIPTAKAEAELEGLQDEGGSDRDFGRIGGSRRIETP